MTLQRLSEGQPVYLNELAKTIHATAWEKGWYDNGERNLGEMIALIHSELSEALESWRNNEQSFFEKDGKPEGWGVELADVIIRVLDMAALYDLDMDTLIYEKLLYNQTRPYRHGGKRI